MEWFFGVLIGIIIGFFTKPVHTLVTERRKKRKNHASPLSDEAEAQLLFASTLVEKVLSAFANDDEWSDEEDRVRSFLANQLKLFTALLRHKENLEHARDILGLSVKNPSEAPAEAAARARFSEAISGVTKRIHAICNTMHELHGEILTVRSSTAVEVNQIPISDPCEVDEIKLLLKTKSLLLIESHIEVDQAPPKSGAEIIEHPARKRG